VNTKNGTKLFMLKFLSLIEITASFSGFYSTSDSGTAYSTCSLKISKWSSTTVTGLFSGQVQMIEVSESIAFLLHWFQAPSSDVW